MAVDALAGRNSTSVKIFFKYIPIQVTIQKKKVSVVQQRKILVLIIRVNVILHLPKSLQTSPMNMIHRSTRLMDLTIQKTVHRQVAQEVARKRSMIAVVSTQ